MRPSSISCGLLAITNHGPDTNASFERTISRSSGGPRPPGSAEAVPKARHPSLPSLRPTDTRSLWATLQGISLQDPPPAMWSEPISGNGTGPQSRQPAQRPEQAASGSSSSLPVLDGTPATPEGRKEPSCCAAQARTLGDLPVHTLDRIVNKVAEAPPYESGLALIALQRTCQAFRGSVKQSKDASRRMMQISLAPKARELADQCCAGGWRNDPVICTPILALLHQTRRAALVDQLLCSGDIDPDSVEDGEMLWDERVRAIENLVPQMRHLEPGVRAKVAAAATSISGDAPHYKAKAIAALGGGLAHLGEEQQIRLLAQAKALGCESQRAVALKGLSAGYEHLTHTVQEDLWAAVHSIRDPSHQCVALQGLCKHLRHLPKRRDILFNQVMDFVRSNLVAGDRANAYKAVSSLAASLAHLRLDQKETLLTVVLQGGLLTWAVRELAAGLAAELQHLAPSGRKRLFDTCLQLAGRDEAQAIQLLAQGWVFLPPDQRHKVVDLVSSLKYETAKARAIGALGPHFAHLGEDQRAALVGQAVPLLSKGLREYQEGAIRALMKGLGTGFGALGQHLRDALFGAVMRMNPSHGIRQANWIGERLRFAAAVSGIGPGLPYLNELQLLALIDATSSLDMSSVPLMMDDRHRIHAVQIRAIAELTGAADDMPPD